MDPDDDDFAQKPKFLKKRLTNPVLSNQRLQMLNGNRWKGNGLPLFGFRPTKTSKQKRALLRADLCIECDICPTNPSLHNMFIAYFKCDNVECECEVEEPDCLCL